MAQLGTTFDATTVEPNKPFEPVPPGQFPAQIVNSEMRLTKDGRGQYLWVEIEIIDGPYAGRRLFDRLNLINANLTTVEIAQRTLSAICHAVGKMQVDDSEQLHLIPLLVDVKVQPPKNGYDASNSIRYLPLERSAAQPVGVHRSTAPAQPAVPPARGAAPAKPNTAPWRRTV